jgi:hypothetical protein
MPTMDMINQCNLMKQDTEEPTLVGFLVFLHRRGIVGLRSTLMRLRDLIRKVRIMCLGINYLLNSFRIVRTQLIRRYGKTGRALQ